MARAIDKKALTAASLLLLCVFGACKKRDEPAPAAALSASVSPAAAASAAIAQAEAAASAAQAAAAAAAASASAATPAASAAPAAPALGDVKRFTDKEKPASGATKVALADSKVFDEPDATKTSVASLPKDLLVTRMAALGADWVLVEFPSGVGKVSPGWMEAKSLVGGAGATNGKPATSTAATASAKPAASAAPSAAPAASASAPKVQRVKPGVLRVPAH